MGLPPPCPGPSVVLLSNQAKKMTVLSYPRRAAAFGWLNIEALTQVRAGEEKRAPPWRMALSLTQAIW